MPSQSKPTYPKPSASRRPVGRPRTSVLKAQTFKLPPALISRLERLADVRYGENKTAALVAAVNEAADRAGIV